MSSEVDRGPGIVRKAYAFAGRHADINFALVDQAVVSGASFLTTVLLARFLGLEEFGRFTLAWLGVFLAQNIQIALLVTPMLTIAAKQERTGAATYRGTMLIHQAVLAFAIAGFVFAGAWSSAWLMPEWALDGLALPLAVLVFFAQWADFMRRYHYAFGRANVSFAVDMLRYGVQIALLVGLLVFFAAGADVADVLLWMAAAALIGALAGVPFLGKAAFEGRQILEVTRRHWMFSRWLTLTAFANWARDNFIFTAVGALLGLAEVGALRATQQLVFVVNVPLQGFSNIVPARAGAAYAKEGFVGLSQFVTSFVVRYMAAIALVLLAIAFSSSWLLAVLFGADYADYGFVVAAFAGVMMIYLLRDTASIMLRAIEATAFEFHGALAASLLVVIGAHPLVAAWGMWGALASFALFECVMLMVLTVGLRNRYAAASARQTKAKA